MRIGLFVSSTALALACAAASGTAAADLATQGSRQAPLLYVTNQNGASISVIDVERQEEVARVDLQALGFGPNAKPHDTALEPDGSFWYVSLIGENRVLKLDRENHIVGQVEMEVPGLVVAHPTRDLLIVGRSMSAVNPPSSVALIRRSDMTLLDEVEVIYPRPHANATRDRWAYSASLAENRIAVIDLDTEDVTLVDLPEPTIRDTAAMAHAEHAGMTPHTLVEFALSPDGRTMVAGGQISGELMVFDLSDPAAPRIVHRVQIGGAPWHPAFTPDGRWVYVPLNRGNQVAVVDTGTWSVVERISGRGIAEPHGAVPSPDGRFMFVSNNNLQGSYVASGPDPKSGTVVVIDVATREIVKVIEVGPNATGLDTVPPVR
ncbi:MAG TPA: beta-propeller fold lactonase family protein [Gemmatimonadota bacterium]|jgi:DNA-binding beta-propeller fold protein YncE